MVARWLLLAFVVLTCSIIILAVKATGRDVSQDTQKEKDDLEKLVD